MKTALIMSSFVAASRVGASASNFCLRRIGIETVTLPTTLYGRHPGWGPPGGGAVDTKTLESMWGAIKAQTITFDAVMTGYMASEAHVELAADIIKTVKANNKDAFILVDPVMGDDGRLYINAAIAQAIKTALLPLADLITPNVWELGYLTGANMTSVDAIFKAAAELHKSAIITSVPDGDAIGAALVTQMSAALVSHKRFAAIPHGGGDALAGTLLGHILSGLEMDAALAKSVAAIFGIISAAIDQDAGELPLVRLQNALTDAPALPIKRYTL